MSRKAYGTTGINWGSFDEWSNNVASDSNTSITTAVGDMFPAQTTPHAASELASKTIFKGKVWAETGGTVAMSAPYTVAATSSSFVCKNIIISSYNITLVATASYPWTFHSWRTASGGGGSSLSTSATWTFGNDTNADYANYYAYFTTTHLNPYA